MSIFKPIETIKSKLDYIQLKHGQYIICTDSQESYIDTYNERIKIGDIILLDTEDDRNSMIVPLMDKLYVVKNTNKLYRYNGSEWLCLSNNNTIFSQRKNYKITSNTPQIPLGIDGLDINTDTILVFLNSVFLEEDTDYRIVNNYLLPGSGEYQWVATNNKPLHFNLVIIKNIPGNLVEIKDINTKNLETKISSITKENALLLYIMMINKINLEEILNYDKFNYLYKNKLWTEDKFSKAIEMGVLSQSDYEKIIK